MVKPHHVVIEVYVLLAVVNTFLGITQEIYSDAFPGESIRSPFDQTPLSSNIDSEASLLDVTGLQQNLTDMAGGPDNALGWIGGAAEGLAATFDAINTFVKFFTAGYVVDLLDGMGFPGQYVYIISVPLGIYTAYMIFVLITNRLTN